jgi:hypothetical protein
MVNAEEAWRIVQDAMLVFRSRVPDIGRAREALAEVLHTGAWARYDSPTGPCEHARFAQWVADPVPAGLNTTVENILRIAGEDTQLRGLLDDALKNPDGRPRKTGNNVPSSRARRPGGNTEAKALRRLRKDRPDLHAEVLADRLSAHAAMVQAGFRPKTVSVPVDRPESIAQTLHRHMKPDDIDRLVELLVEYKGG